MKGHLKILKIHMKLINVISIHIVNKCSSTTINNVKLRFIDVMLISCLIFFPCIIKDMGVTS